MRAKILIAVTLLSGLLIARNLHVIMTQLPDELNQGAVYRIIYFHVPAAFTAMVGALVSFVASILYLTRKEMRYDAMAVAGTEVALTFGAVNLVTGMLWARPIWGIWWTWDARLTSMLVIWLMYAGYLMLRKAVDDPTSRARNAAVLSVFTFPGTLFVWKAIEWFRTQHPGPVLSIRNGGGMAAGMEGPLYLNFLALALLSAVVIAMRMRQEQAQRELDGIRQSLYAA